MMRNMAVILGAAFVVTSCCSFFGATARSAEPLILISQTGEHVTGAQVALDEPSSAKKSETTAPKASDNSSVSPPPPKLAFQWWPLLLPLPGLMGLWLAAVKEHWIPEDKAGQNRFLIAAVAGTIWLITLWLMAISLPLSNGQSHFPLFTVYHSNLGFYLFVPIFGYVGSLLYVLDLSRRGLEEIPKGTEFGMRLVMAPYVAIVMVLFAQELGFANGQSPIAQGVLAFFSGLLVVLAFQGLVEKGQEVLGSWRAHARYAPSEIAKELDLTKEEDLGLRKADLQMLSQFCTRSASSLKDDAKHAKLDEGYLRALQEEAQKAQIKKSVGRLAWQALGTTVDVKTVEDFAHLSDQALDDVASKNTMIDVNGLKTLRDEALLSVAPKPVP